MSNVPCMHWILTIEAKSLDLWYFYWWAFDMEPHWPEYCNVLLFRQFLNLCPEGFVEFCLLVPSQNILVRILIFWLSKNIVWKFSNFLTCNNKVLIFWLSPKYDWKLSNFLTWNYVQRMFKMLLLLQLWLFKQTFLKCSMWQFLQNVTLSFKISNIIFKKKTF